MRLAAALLFCAFAVTPAPAQVAAPWSENFDSGIPGWTLASSSPSVVWAADATPAFVVPGMGSSTFAGSAASLNFNDGVDYASGEATSGTATSPVLDVTGMGLHLEVWFQCNYQTETTSSSPDRRVLEVLDADTGLTVAGPYRFAEVNDSNPPLTTCSVMGSWHPHHLLIPLNSMVTHIQLRFGFDSLDPVANGFSGWFVDNLMAGCGDTMPPTQPSPVSPADEATVPPGVPVPLDWSDSTDSTDCAPGAIACYQVETATDQLFMLNLTEELVPVSAATMTFAGPGTYYWRAKAIDFAGNLSAYTSIRTIHVCGDSLPPSIPENLLPVDGAVLASGDPLALDWTDATDTTDCGPGVLDRYEIQLSLLPDFSVAMDFATADDTSGFTIPGNLPPGSYYWHVRAFDGAGNNSAYSKTTTFELKRP
jgi:hypothetical protein